MIKSPVLRSPDPAETTVEVSSETSPVSPIENPDKQKDSENELFSTPGATSKGSLLERIRQTGARIIQSRGITFRKGGGRPRKDGLPGKLDEIIEGQIPTAQNPVTFDPASPVDQATVSLCRRSIVAAVKAFDWLAKKLVRIKAEAAKLEPAFIEKALLTAEPDPKALEDFQASLDAVLKKHNFKPENDEEWALAIDAGRLFAPYLILLATFNAEIERRKIEELKLARKEEKKNVSE